MVFENVSVPQSVPSYLKNWLMESNKSWWYVKSLYSDTAMWKEKDNSYTTKFNVAGIKKEQIKVTFRDGYVCVKIYHQDRTSTNQNMIVPTFADTDKISAKLEDGILIISVPKTEHAKLRGIEIS